MPSKIFLQTANKCIVQFEFEITGSMLNSEINLLEAINEAGTLATHNILEQFDVDGEIISFGGNRMSSKGKVECAYQTPYGEAKVQRHVYQGTKGGKTYCPLESNARIIVSATPFFAKQISSKYADFGGLRVAGDFCENHGRKIAKGFIQNVAEAVAAVALAKEEKWNYEVPKMTEKVSTISIGIDGTCMLTVEDGWRQAMVGTIALHNSDGERLHTTYIGAIPEHGKDTFLNRMTLEIERAQKKYPKVTTVAIADGARDNWPFLAKYSDKQCLDFFHATEYLVKAADAAFYKDKTFRKTWLDEACHRLKHNKTGPKTLLEEIKNFKKKHIGDDRKTILDTVITYFENNLKIMKYKEHLDDNLPIGSGITEAACKVIVKQRLCNSGMRWKDSGAATVLSLRTLSYTIGRWDRGNASKFEGRQIL
jgi:hypothetical protein